MRLVFNYYALDNLERGMLVCSSASREWCNDDLNLIKMSFSIIWVVFLCLETKFFALSKGVLAKIAIKNTAPKVLYTVVL